MQSRFYGGFYFIHDTQARYVLWLVPNVLSSTSIIGFIVTYSSVLFVTTVYVLQLYNVVIHYFNFPRLNEEGTTVVYVYSRVFREIIDCEKYTELI